MYEFKLIVKNTGLNIEAKASFYLFVKNLG